RRSQAYAAGEVPAVRPGRCCKLDRGSEGLFDGWAGPVMAHVQRRNDRPGWVARYVDPSGRERSQSFRRKVDAERFLTAMESSKLRGEWIDPRLARTTLLDFSERWVGTISDKAASTKAGYMTKLNVHVLPVFGGVQLRAISGLAIR